jgi:predicted RNase H-like HicB family nuclease
MRQVVLYCDEDGFWQADCPSLPGCTCQGRSEEEVLDGIKQAIDRYIAELVEYGEPVPQDGEIRVVVV